MPGATPAKEATTMKRRVFEISFRTGNAAFENGQAEIARILEEVARCVRDGASWGAIRDSNGNSIGEWGLRKCS